MLLTNRPKSQPSNTSEQNNGDAFRIVEKVTRYVQQNMELTDSEKPLGVAIQGLVSFHERYLKDEKDISSLPAELQNIYQAILFPLSELFLREMRLNEKRYFITAWSEGEIYRMQSDYGEYIIAKRRYDSGSNSGTNRECELQSAAHKIAEQFSGVKVPWILGRIPDKEKNCEYIIMECVPGKTIWTLALEALMNNGIVQENLSTENPNPIINYYASRKNWKGLCQNDTEAELAIIEHYRAITEKTGGRDPGVRERDEHGNISYPVLREHIEKDIPKIAVFDEATILHIRKVLRPFLTALHEQGIYHRDLNVRNLMIGEDGEVYVIDFGKWVQTSGNNDSVYHAQEWRYDNDFDILALLASYWPKEENEAAKIVRWNTEAVNRSRTQVSSESILFAAEWMHLNPDRLEKIVNSAQDVKSLPYLKNLFENYLNGKAERISPNTYIRLKPRTPENKETTERWLYALLSALLLVDRGTLEEYEKYIQSYMNTPPKNFPEKLKNRLTTYGDYFLKIIELVIISKA